MKYRTMVLALASVAGTPALAQSAPDDERDVVVVTATRSEQDSLNVAASVTTRNVDELRQQGFTYGTDEFRGVPGVFFRRGEGDGDEFPFVTVRGITGNHGNDTFLALVDGIPFVGADEEVLLYEVPYGAVERVEDVRGPVSALYGRGAIAGAVNYLTRTPTGSGGRLSVSAGSDDYYRAEGLFENGWDGGGFIGSATCETYEGWREHSARQNLNLFGKAKFSLSSQTRLTAYLNYLDRESEVPGAIPTLADGTIPPVAGGDEGFLGYGDTRNELTGVLASLRLDHEASDTGEIAFSAQSKRFELRR